MLKNGADPDIKDSQLRSALMFASATSFIPGVEILIEYNADVNANTAISPESDLAIRAAMRRTKLDEYLTFDPNNFISPMICADIIDILVSPNNTERIREILSEAGADALSDNTEITSYHISRCLG